MATLLPSQPEPSMPNTALLIKNPLAATHEFKQACQLCYPKTGNVTPLSRDIGNLESITSPNNRTLVYPSEAWENRIPAGYFKQVGGGVWMV